jgi:hypothetical protein
MKSHSKGNTGKAFMVSHLAAQSRAGKRGASIVHHRIPRCHLATPAISLLLCHRQTHSHLSKKNPSRIKAIRPVWLLCRVLVIGNWLKIYNGDSIGELNIRPTPHQRLHLPSRMLHHLARRLIALISVSWLIFLCAGPSVDLILAKRNSLKHGVPHRVVSRTASLIRLLVLT